MKVKNFQKIVSDKWNIRYDLFALTVSHPFSQYMSWKINPFSGGRDAFQISWAHKSMDAIHNFSLESKSGLIYWAHNNPNMIRLIIFPNTSENVCKKPTTSTQRSTERSCRKVKSIRNAEFTATSSLDNLRQSLYM